MHGLGGCQLNQHKGRANLLKNNMIIGLGNNLKNEILF